MRPFEGLRNSLGTSDAADGRCDAVIPRGELEGYRPDWYAVPTADGFDALNRFEDLVRRLLVSVACILLRTFCEYPAAVRCRIQDSDAATVSEVDHGLRVPVDQGMAIVGDQRVEVPFGK